MSPGRNNLNKGLRYNNYAGRRATATTYGEFALALISGMPMRSKNQMARVNNDAAIRSGKRNIEFSGATNTYKDSVIR